MATSHHPPRPGVAPILLGLILVSTTAAAQGAAPAPAAAPATPPAARAGAGEADAADDTADLPARSAAPPNGATQAAPGPASKEPAAPEPEPEKVEAPAAPDWQNAPPQRRGGFTVGLAVGLALGTAAGYPNDIEKLGFERYYTETGVGVGTGGFLWLGGALTDWLSFGVGVGGLNLSAESNAVTSGGFVFHIETFPLFPLGGQWRDVGITIDTGTAASYTTADDKGDERVIDGALPAKIGGGVFYEGIRFWKVATGPWLYADYVWSSSVRQGAVYLGWRTALYAKP